MVYIFLYKPTLSFTYIYKPVKCISCFCNCKNVFFPDIIEMYNCFDFLRNNCIVLLYGILILCK